MIFLAFPPVFTMYAPLSFSFGALPTVPLETTAPFMS